jgi:drug/metabolite transporter (DMT)-like permease
LVSAALHVVYQLVLQRGYGEGDLNLVYPLARGSGPLLTFVVAVAVLDERPGVLAAVGVGTVVAGVLLISLVGRRVLHRTSGVLWGLATGATIASYTLWDSHSVTGLGVPPVPYFALGLVLQLPFLTLLVHGPDAPARVGEAWASARRQALTIAALSPLAYLLVLRAMQLAPVALVAAGREASIVVGAGFGWLVLREPRPVPRLLGAGMVLLGIGLLSVG